MDKETAYKLVKENSSSLAGFIITLLEGTALTPEQFRAIRKLILDRCGEDQRKLKATLLQ